MKTCVLNIAPGKIVKYHDEPCMVLEHRQDGTLLLELDSVSRAFGSSNNYASSSLRAYYNGTYLVSITDSNPDEIITRTVDLTAFNNSTEYGTVECKLAPLTLDELRKYHDILPRPEVFEWSASPWSTPKVDEVTNGSLACTPAATSTSTAAPTPAAPAPLSSSPPPSPLRLTVMRTKRAWRLPTLWSSMPPKNWRLNCSAA